jgi:hypothetical protein
VSGSSDPIARDLPGEPGRAGELVAEQAAQLARVPGVAEAFHPPVANNFVYMLIPRERDQPRYVQKIKETTAALNRADEALLDRCAALLHDRRHPDGERAIEGWRACIQRRANLQGIRWAQEVAGILERLGISLPEHLRMHHQDTLDRFRSVPRSLLEVVRINGYLAPARIEPLLEAITEHVRRDGIEGPIERVEVARRPTAQPIGSIDYPTLIVYCNADSMTDAALEAAISRLASLFGRSDPAPSLRTALAHPLTRNATLTQGFFLYKRYLQVVGILDELYDPAFGHALSRGSRLARIHLPRNQDTWGPGFA